MNHPITPSTALNRVDPIRIKWNLLVISLFIIAVAASFFAFKTGNILFMVGLVALPFILMLIGKPAFVFTSAIIMDALGYNFTGVNLTSTGMVSRLMLIVIFIISSLLSVQGWKRVKVPEDRPLKLFGAVIIGLMLYRGSGLRMLGSEIWGGMIYVNLLIGLIFFFVINGMKIDKKYFHWIIWGSFVVSIVGSLMTQMSGSSMRIEEGSILAERQSWLIPMAYALLPLSFVIKLRHNGYILNIIIFVVTLGIIALTGFRSRIVEFCFVAGLFWFFHTKRKGEFIIILTLLGLISYALLIGVSDSLPDVAQRAISFIPGIQVSDRVAADAAGSTEWRVEIWQYCLAQAKDYLWIGRGSAFGLHETIDAIGVNAGGRLTPWIAFLTRNYHSGPLALLIDYGLIGFISVFWLTVLVLKRMGSYISRLKNMRDSFESRYILYLCVHQIWYWISFYLVYGSMRKLSEIITGVAVLMVLMGSYAAIEKQAADKETADDAHALPEGVV
jgi:hypothetical protein